MNRFSRVISLVIALAFVAGLAVFPTAAVTGTVTVGFSCPVIATDAGKSVRLKDYAVEFSSGASIAASDVTWSSSALSVSADGSVAPTAAGVYELTATAGSKSRKVYLVAKNAADSEYVLYYNDFSGADISDFTVVQQSSGATVAVESGKLVLDASSSSSNYIRILLPEWLSVFGNCKITADFTMAKAASSSNWISIMARVQNNNIPYWQACLRQNATASNGTEIAERTAANKWNVTHTGAYTESISASKQYTFSFELQGSNAATAINGTPMLYSTAVNLTSGRMGLQTRGVKLVVDSIKVTVPTSAIEIPEPNVHTTREASPPLAMTPTIVTRVSSAAELKALGPLSPSVAMLYVNSALRVTSPDGTEELCSLAEALEQTGKSIIPAFCINDSATVSALCAELKKLNLKDVIFVASDADLLGRARSTYTASQGVLDCTGVTVSSTSELYALREKANTARARVIMLSDTTATRDNVEYLQRLFMTVWSVPENNASAYLSAITSGANGIIVADRAAYDSMLTKYFEKNTLTRLVNVIGHRGLPSLSQENTIASSVLAYEKGATMIENDIYLTSDGVIVVMHDSTVDRTTNGTGRVESFTYEQLKKLSVNVNASAAAEPIPMLEDYFKEFKGKDVQLVIEIKKDASTDIVPALAKLIAQYDIADQVNVITFSDTFVGSMRAQLPGISTGFLTSSITPSESAVNETLESILDKVGPLATTYNPSFASGALGPKLMHSLSERGLTVWPWTVNGQSDFDKYLLLGTNGITTNFSQYVTNYTRRIDAPADEVTVGADGTEFKITRLTYGRVATEITNAQLVVVEDGGTGVRYTDGRLSVSGSGEATVYFRLACRTTSGTTYYLCTEPVLVKAASASDTTPSNTTPSDTTPGDTSPSEPVPGKTGGCGSTLGLAALVALIPAAFVLKKKKH